MSRLVVRIKEIIKHVESKGLQGWEVYLSNDRLTNIDIGDSKVEFISSGEKTGIGVRVFREGRVGFSFSDDVSDYRRCIDKAVKIASLNDKDPDFMSFAKPNKAYPHVSAHNKALADYTVKDFSDFMGSFVDIVKGYDKRISVGTGVYKNTLEVKRIVNSLGVDFEESATSNSVFFESLSLNTGEENIILELGRAENEPFGDDVAHEFAGRLVSMVGKKTVETKKMDVLFHPEAIGALLDEFVSHSFDAENESKGRSILSGKIGEKMFHESLTISDDATVDGYYDSRKGDDEGTPSQKTTLVRKGEVAGFLYDTYNAYKEGKESTGNGVRTAFSSPSISPTNVIISPGHDDDLVSQVRHGLHVKGLMGVHTMNAATGDFSLGVYEGHKIEKGSAVHPLKDTMISGNMLDLLNSITAIGRKPRHYAGDGGSIYTPEILVSGIQVIGSR